MKKLSAGLFTVSPGLILIMLLDVLVVAGFAAIARQFICVSIQLRLAARGQANNCFVARRAGAQWPACLGVSDELFIGVGDY